MVYRSKHTKQRASCLLKSMIDTSTETFIVGVAPAKIYNEGSEMGSEAGNGCKCGSNCTCDPCKCK
ncbi:metallothionein-like protein type 2 [Fagus crenata]